MTPDDQVLAERVNDFLAVLAVALGAMPAADVRAVTPLTLAEYNRIRRLWRVMRWLRHRPEGDGAAGSRPIT